MDRIFVKGLEIFAYHGVNEYEKRDGQRFVFDCTVWRDLALPCVTDEVADTLSYAKLGKLIKAVATNTGYNLLERLGDEIIREIFKEYREVGRIELTIKKPDVAIADLVFDCVGVTLVKERTDV